MLTQYQQSVGKDNVFSHKFFKELRFVYAEVNLEHIFYCNVGIS